MRVKQFRGGEGPMWIQNSFISQLNIGGGRSQFIKTGNPSINLSNALSKIESLCAGDLLPLHATGRTENWCHSCL